MLHGSVPSLCVHLIPESTLSGASIPDVSLLHQSQNHPLQNFKPIPNYTRFLGLFMDLTTFKYFHSAPSCALATCLISERDIHYM